MNWWSWGSSIPFFECIWALLQYGHLWKNSYPNTDNLAVSEDESVDEAVPIDIRKERKTKAYKETMSQDINNIDTYETRTKVDTTKMVANIWGYRWSLYRRV